MIFGVFLKKSGVPNVREWLNTPSHIPMWSWNIETTFFHWYSRKIGVVNFAWPYCTIERKWYFDDVFLNNQTFFISKWKCYFENNFRFLFNLTSVIKVPNTCCCIQCFYSKFNDWCDALSFLVDLYYWNTIVLYTVTKYVEYIKCISSFKQNFLENIQIAVFS